MAESGTAYNRNYPPGFTCDSCGRERVCRKDCKEKTKGFYEGDGKYKG